MYTPPPSLQQPKQYAQLCKRGAWFFGIVAISGLLRFILPFEEGAESMIGIVALIVAIGFLPKADVPWLISLGASFATVMLALGAVLLIGILFGVPPELGIFMAGTLMSTLCWIGYAVAKQGSSPLS